MSGKSQIVPKIVALSVLAVLVMSLAFVFKVSGQRPRGDKDSAKDVPADLQWEYLIVSGGNLNVTGFGNESSMRKQTDAFSNEAYPLERNLDKLGAKGWELVSVSGSPANPVFYLKRLKDGR